MIFRSNSQCHLFVELLQFLQSFCTQTEQGDIAKNSCCVSFFKYLDKHASLAKERGREGEFVKLKTTTKRFRDFLERDHLLGEDGDLTFEMITPDLMERFEKYLKEGLLSINTTSFYIRKIRAYYYKGVQEGLCLPLSNPFERVYTGVSKTQKRALDINSLKLIKNVPLKGRLDFSRDLFLFSFYTRGMAFIDIAKLKHINISSGILTYYRSKTGQLIRVKLENCAMELIEKYSGQSGSDYIFPILSSGGKERKYATELKNHNNRLKQIAGKTKIDLPLTSYVARHSWASIAKRGGVPIATISECMGHTSERTTAIYLASFEENVIDEANRLTILSLD